MRDGLGLKDDVIFMGFVSGDHLPLFGSRKDIDR